MNQIYILAELLIKTVNEKYATINILFKYFQAVVKILNKYKAPVRWEAPNGLIINQFYDKLHKTSLSFNINYKRIKTVVYKKKNIMDLVKSKAAIAPNIIHSLDSSLLSFIVNDFDKKDILTIHDCFMVLPNDMKDLYELLVKQYINVYCDHDFLNSFNDGVIKS
jgi:DNA-directed RNA polymerase